MSTVSVIHVDESTASDNDNVAEVSTTDETTTVLTPAQKLRAASSARSITVVDTTRPAPIESPDPSTYFQVLDNIEKINELIEFFSKTATTLGETKTTVDSIQERLTDPDDPDATIFDQMDKLADTLEALQGNLTFVTNSITVSNNPSSYNNNITYEIKQAGAIGLGSDYGYESTEHVLLITYSTANIADTTLKSYQLATANGKKRWFRQAVSDTNWGPWSTDESVAVEESNGWAYSETQPTDQSEGDFWITPIDGVT